MKSVLIYTVGTLLFSPCVLAASDDILGVLIAMMWGVLCGTPLNFADQSRDFGATSGR